MSTFFSNKYLKYRRMLERRDPPIDANVACVKCGYNLRGLSPGGRCPECGSSIPLHVSGVPDPLLGHDPRQRLRLLWGLTLMSLVIAGLVGVRVGGSVVLAIADWPASAAYFGVITMLGLAWSVGVWLATPASLDAGRRGRAPLRWFARFTQSLWAPAGALRLAAASVSFRAWEEQLMFWAYASMALAVLGWLVLAFIMLQASEDVELDDAPRRIGMAIWTVAPLTAILTVLPLRMYFFTLALFAPVLLAWAWYLIGYARGLWELRQYVSWGVRQSHDHGGREQRIAARKAELDAIANARIRAMPPRPHAPPTKPGPIPPRRLWE